jgi:hypothetical protein
MTADLLALSDERDTHLMLRDRAYREGYAEGARGQWSAGYAAAMTDMKRVQLDLVATLDLAGDLARRRWVVRGEQRTRETYGQPHPDDYMGRGAA